MMAPPEISVVMATYRRPGEWLGRAAESVLRQRRVAGELVLVNDGGPREAIPADLRREPRVRVLDLAENGGPGRARNVGIDASRGRWIAYLDDDDEYAPEHLARVTAALGGRHRLAYSVGERQVVQDGRVVSSTAPGAHPYSRAALLVGNYIPLPTVVHDRGLGERFDERLPVLEDWEFLLRASERTPFAFVPEVTTAYRYHVRGEHRSNGEELSDRVLAAVYRRTAAEAARTAGVVERRRLALARRRARRAAGIAPWAPVDFAWMFPQGGA